MYKPIATGTDDFKKIRETGSLFIDKTNFIKELIDDSSESLLFPRPRRFGKSINLSMIKYYFDIKEDSKDLFKGLKIMNYGDRYINEMNKYPVISLTLKECKKNTYEEFITDFKSIISNLYSQYDFLLKSEIIRDIDKEYMNRCINEQEEKQLHFALSRLSLMLEKYYNQKVYVLLDEYDAPILSSYLNGFYDKCINFMRDLFSATFKGNLSMKKGIITGILRVSKEDMFSGANNIKVYNITDYNYSNHFGFTEEEVKDVLNQYDLSGNFNKIKKWYDGYRFSDYVVYNPWSILNYLSDRKHTLQAYWVNTGGVDLLRNLIYGKRNTGLLEEYHKLLETNEVCNVNLDMYMDLRSLDNSRDTIWTLFMLAGYLTPKGNVINNKNVTLRIPNLEIKENLENVCVKWFNDNISYKDILEEDLINNNMNEFKKTFIDIVNESFSYYDVERRYGENFYHAFCMGLLYSYNYHFKITSNRESGYGRYDLLLKPINNSCNNAYIIEFKSIENDNFDETIEKAFNQIEEKKYDIELKEEGYHINKIVIVFKYKEIKMEIR